MSWIPSVRLYVKFRRVGHTTEGRAQVGGGAGRVPLGAGDPAARRQGLPSQRREGAQQAQPHAQAQAGGAGLVVYSRQEGNALGEVANEVTPFLAAEQDLAAEQRLQEAKAEEAKARAQQAKAEVKQAMSHLEQISLEIASQKASASRME